MSFETLHAQVDHDPVAELRRRLQLWASAPDSRGHALDACIVPRKTVVDAIAAIEAAREFLVKE